jgi:hypothetical protein
MNRRSFLATVAAGLAAPAVVRAESLMRLARPARYAMAGGVLAPVFDWSTDPRFMVTRQEWRGLNVDVSLLSLRDRMTLSFTTRDLGLQVGDVVSVSDGSVRPVVGRFTSVERWRFAPSDVADIERGVVALPAHHAME